MLLRLQVEAGRGPFAELKKSTELVPEIGEQLELDIGY
jgi:hypothetical protein